MEDRVFIIIVVVGIVGIGHVDHKFCGLQPVLDPFLERMVLVETFVIATVIALSQLGVS